MAYAGLPVKEQYYLMGHDECREVILASLRSKSESNDRVLEKLYAIHLRSINWKWPWSPRQRRRERMLQAASDRLYYEAQEAHAIAIELIWAMHGQLDNYLRNKTPA